MYVNLTFGDYRKKFIAMREILVSITPNKVLQIIRVHF